MNAARLKRWSLWGALLLTVYLTLAVEEGPPDTALEPSVAVRAASPVSASAEPVAMKTPSARRAWQEDAHGNPFQVKTWYVPKAAHVAPPPPKAPRLPYYYFGRMTEDDTVFAYLQQGNKVVIAKAGDVLGPYRIENIDAREVTFVYLPLNERQTAGLGVKNEPPEGGLEGMGMPQGLALNGGMPGLGKKEEKEHDE